MLLLGGLRWVVLLQINVVLWLHSTLVRSRNRTNLLAPVRLLKRWKTQKYGAAVAALDAGRANPPKFVPFVLESGGHLGVKAVQFVDDLLEKAYDDKQEALRRPTSSSVLLR